MRRLVYGVLGGTLVALLISGTSHASPKLQQDPKIDSELMAAAVGDRIRRKCDSISARMVVVITRAKALERYARSAGYDEKEVTEYLDSKTEQKRFKERAKAYLAQRGAVSGDDESVCEVGRAEIAAKSPIGTLLKSR